MSRNIYLEFAEGAAQCGEDMERVAKDLTEALAWVVTEGVGDEHADQELLRLWKLATKGDTP